MTIREAPGPFAIGSRTWPGVSRVIEEAGELIGELGKLMSTGGAADHGDGTNLVRRITEEIADLRAALIFLAASNPALSDADIAARTRSRLSAYRTRHYEGLAAGDEPAH